MSQSNNILKIFLLGGHDLEMMTIKKILTDKNFHVVDKNLYWSNAKLSMYKEELARYSSNQYRIYGIELQEKDIDEIPENYTRIDHHNEHQIKATALEQVAEIIGHKLNEEELLIAANDRGYYPEMEKVISVIHKDWSCDEMKAKMEEIRKKDRKSQGVSDEEEKNAPLVSKFKHGEYTLVITDIQHFSPICDNLWPYEKLLVCRPIEGNASLCYYGKDSQKSHNEFTSKYPNFDTYSGGGEDGYWGISDNNISLGELYKIVSQFVPVDISEFSKYIKSGHIFYFPFIWNWTDKAKLNKSDVFNKLNEPKSDKWLKRRICNNKKQDNEERATLFNELNYFFPFVHKELYEYSDEIGEMLSSILDEGEKSKWINEPRILHFERAERDLTYEIVVKENEIWRKYSLQIRAINLNLYSTGVGLLSLYTRNNTGFCVISNDKNNWGNAEKRIIDRDDILKINQFGRRVMPPFYKDLDNRSEIAESIRIYSSEIDLYDDFSEFKKTENKIIKPSSWKYSKVIEGLLSDFTKEIKYRIVIDDRMFVMSWYKNGTCLSWAKNDLHNCLTDNQTDKTNTNGYNYWYKFLFVDNQSATCQNEHMRQELLRRHSYIRWTDWNSLYGVTRYSFVYLTNGSVPPYLLDYFESMYARMVELVLMQRATVLKFSERVNMLNNHESYDERDRERLQTEINNLYKDYIVFKNKFYFKEITAQDQGIEIYDMLQNSLRLEEMVRDLDEDIQELHQFDSILEEQEGNRKAQTLNFLMSIFTPASCVAALLTLGDWRTSWTGSNDPWFVCGIGVIAAILTSAAFYIGIKVYNKKKNNL